MRSVIVDEALVSNPLPVESWCFEPASEPAQIVARPTEFDDVYEAWFGEVSRWVRAMGGPAADREDLVQDVFVTVFRRLPDFDGRNLAGWLYQIARHRVRDFRRLCWVRHVLTPGLQLSDRLANDDPTPVESLELKERQRLLGQLLGRLNENERAALVLFEIEGYSGEQIATIQGVPLNTVWARIYKARKKLKRALTRHEAARSALGLS